METAPFSSHLPFGTQSTVSASLLEDVDEEVGVEEEDGLDSDRRLFRDRA